MSSAATLKNRPQQARSQATLERLVSAAKRLIETRDWNDITMSEIAKEAKSSVGSLYARFDSKQTLLDHLDEDYARSLIEFCHNHGPDFARRQKYLNAFVHTLSRDLAAFHQNSPGLIRALVMETRQHRHKEFTKRTQRMNESAVSIFKAFGYFERDIAHEDKVRAISWAVFSLWSLTRERILFSESIPAPGHDDPDGIAHQVAETILAYLRSPAARARKMSE